MERKRLTSTSRAKRQKSGKGVPMYGWHMERIDHLRDEAARAAKSATTRRSYTTKEVLELAERVRELNEVWGERRRGLIVVTDDVFVRYV